MLVTPGMSVPASNFRNLHPPLKYQQKSLETITKQAITFCHTADMKRELIKYLIHLLNIDHIYIEVYLIVIITERQYVAGIYLRLLLLKLWILQYIF